MHIHTFFTPSFHLWLWHLILPQKNFSWGTRVHQPRLVSSIPFPSHFCMKILTSSCWGSQTSSSYYWHCTMWFVDCQKCHHQTFVEIAITWQKSSEKLPPHLPTGPKLLKKLVSTNFCSIVKKTTYASTSSQPIEQATALRPCCKQHSLCFGQRPLLVIDLSAAFLNSCFWYSFNCTKMVLVISLRQIPVHFRNLSSPLSHLMNGVIQGSVVRPVLFYTLHL